MGGWQSCNAPTVTIVFTPNLGDYHGTATIVTVISLI